MPTRPEEEGVQDRGREQLENSSRWEGNTPLPVNMEYVNPWVEDEYPAIDMEEREEEQPAIEMQDQPHPLMHEAPLPLEMESTDRERGLERMGWEFNLNVPIPRWVEDRLPQGGPVVEFPGSDPEEELLPLQHEERLPLQQEERLPLQHEERLPLQREERLPLQQVERLPLQWEGRPLEDSSEVEEDQEDSSRLRPRPVVHPADQEWIQARKRKYEENSSEEDRQRRAGRRGMTEEEIDEMLLHVGGVDAGYRERQSLDSLNQQQGWIREMKSRLRRVDHQC
jgi:hypothetical protein